MTHQEHAKTSPESPRLGFFSARFKEGGFFICRVVARQITPVYRSQSLNPVL